MSIAVVPGSYDPVTLGHLDVIRRAATVFDQVIAAVATNTAKASLLPEEQRVALLTAAVGTLDLHQVRVGVVPGLLADFCREVGASVIVKGVRGHADYESELAMAQMNRHLAAVETVFLPTDPAVAHIASSLVKDVARYGGRIEDLVPPGVAEAVQAALAARG